MTVPFSSAAAAYANMAGSIPKLGAKAPAGEGPSFGEMLKEATQEAIGTLHEGERMSTAGIVGKADLTDVVTAVSNAEITLQAVVNIRDKVIGAYQEILRMPM